MMPRVWLLNLGQRHLPLLCSDAANCCSTFEPAQADDPANVFDRSTAGKLPKQPLPGDDAGMAKVVTGMDREERIEATAMRLPNSATNS